MADNLKPCPFCGGEASVKVLEYDGDCKVWGVFCESDLESEYSHGHFVDNYPTEAEAIAAWNTRAAVEFDNWFYLPKPKEAIVQYGEREITKTENGYKVRQLVDVIDEAARKWGDELDEHIMKRICEVWNARAERTCHDTDANSWHFTCSSCGYEQNGYEQWNYCPNCGARVIA